MQMGFKIQVQIACEKEAIDGIIDELYDVERHRNGTILEILIIERVK